MQYAPSAGCTFFVPVSLVSPYNKGLYVIKGSKGWFLPESSTICQEHYGTGQHRRMDALQPMLGGRFFLQGYGPCSMFSGLTGNYNTAYAACK
jgi:hypothetical protein